MPVITQGLEKDVNAAGRIKGYQRDRSQDMALQPSPKMECGSGVEHLNSYNRYYIPQIQLAILRQEEKTEREFGIHPRVAGAYFTRIMKPTAQALWRTNAGAKDHRPTLI
jgi:hypothetical protein